MQSIDSFEQLSAQHYENFPVALWILPKAWRKTIRLIYAFARQADDIADEGNCTPEERLAQLDFFSKQLSLIQQQIETKKVSDDLTPFFKALCDCIDTHQLPLAPFFDLITAFRQDVVKSS